MIVGLREVAVALVLLVAFIAGSFAVGDMAAHGCLLPREVWPGMVFEAASAGLVGASLGAVWLWGMSR